MPTRPALRRAAATLTAALLLAGCGDPETTAPSPAPAGLEPVSLPAATDPAAPEALPAAAPTQEPPMPTSDAVPPALAFTMTSLSGEPVPLERYRDKVVLVVNTASKCGHTPQYAPLQTLHEKYGGQGLAVLGFPANNFGRQEPGTDEQIAEFCQKNYGVTFDMFSKISVAGEDQHPFFAHLTSQDAPPGGSGPVKWNFEKFLIDRQGRVVGRFRSKTKPDSPEMTQAIETALAAK